MNGIDILKAFFFGIVEGVTEWLPISSTGHMILLDEFLQLNVSPEFFEMFLVVIQLGAIFAVVVLYWKYLFPFKKGGGVKKDVITLWGKMIVACIPAGIIGYFYEDIFNALFYNPVSVSLALIIFGVLFIIIERLNKTRLPRVTELNHLSLKDAFVVGLFQVVAAVFPGASRSGSTILGSISIGLSRTVAADFSFLLAVPVMFGASTLKLQGFGFSFTTEEAFILLVGMVVAFIVSMGIIKFLLRYIKKHDFSLFGWYRIVLGVVVLVYFLSK